MCEMLSTIGCDYLSYAQINSLAIRLDMIPRHCCKLNACRDIAPMYPNE